MNDADGIEIDTAAYLSREIRRRDEPPLPPEHDPGPIFRLGDRVRTGDRRGFGLVASVRRNDGGHAYSVAWTDSMTLDVHAEQDLRPA